MFTSGVSNEKLFTSPNNGRETELHNVKILSYVSIVCSTKNSLAASHDKSEVCLSTRCEMNY
jgi:hypothetical protein